MFNLLNHELGVQVTSRLILQLIKVDFKEADLFRKFISSILTIPYNINISDYYLILTCDINIIKQGYCNRFKNIVLNNLI